MLTACTTLPEVEHIFESREGATYIYFSSDQTLRPGMVTQLPLNLMNPTPARDILTPCGMSPVINRNGGFIEPMLQGNWLSKRVWIRYGAPEAKALTELTIMRQLAATGYSIASFAFDDLDLEVLDPIETSYAFYSMHQDWKTNDFMKHFSDCLPSLDRDDYVIHQVMTGRIRIKLHTFLGIPVFRSAKTDILMAKMGFVPQEHTSSEYVSINRWSIARTSRLRLGILGFFRQP